SLLPTPMASNCYDCSVTFQYVHGRLARGHVVSWIGIATYLRGFESRVRQPAVFGSTPRIPYRAHRLRALGNAVMPEMSRLVGECILRREAELASASVPPQS